METLRRLVVARGPGERTDEQVKHRGFLGQRKYSV